MDDVALYLILVLGGLALIGLLLFLLIRKRHILLSSALGAAGLFLLNLTSFGVGWSLLSVLSSVVLGLPGLAMLLFLRLF